MSKASPQTIRIYELHRQGLRPRQIADELKVTPNTVSGALWRLRQMTGEPSPRRAKPRKMHKIVADARYPQGAVAQAFDAGMTEDVRIWAVQTAQDEEYATLADFLCELVVAEFYRRKENE